MRPASTEGMQPWPALSMLAFATLWNASAVLSLATLARRPRARVPDANPPTLEGVTVLKPLCGTDTALRENLRSFFVQEHPRFELLFGVEGEDDPAVEIVRSLMSEYPSVRATLVVHRGGRGINPKVSNLRATIERQPPLYDLVLISDSNTCVSPTFLRDMEETFHQRGAGLVTSIVAADGEETLGALLDNATMNCEVAGDLALLNVTRAHPAVLGKSLLFRRAELERLGGFESVASLLAEDYVIARMFAEAGHRVEVAHEIIRSPTDRATVRSYLQRHVRWAAMRWRLSPLTLALEPFTRPLGAALAAAAMGLSPALALGWAIALMALRDGAAHGLMRGSKGLALALLSGPLREVLRLFITASAMVVRQVSWRGKRVRLSSGTRLYVRDQRARSLSS
jgi:ceramide glucosyltransferase